MEVKQSEFIKSAVTKDQYPEDDRIEVAFVGRSNVGKSSLINSLTKRKKLAKTSNTPGRTRLINFFLINNSIYFVDLPGYGYAKVSGAEKEKWGKMIEDYLLTRRQLGMVILLIDSRHKPTNDDVLMLDWIRHYEHEFIIVCTKSDKLSNNELVKNEKVIRETLKLDSKDKILFYSSTTNQGRDKLLKLIFEEE